MLMPAGIIACLLQLAAGDSALPRPITELVHTTWTAKEGAPTEIWALAQGADGYLWIGSTSGLVRFDGVRFVPFTPIPGDTLPTGGVRRLLTGRDGSLWIGWRSAALSRLRDGRLTTWDGKGDLPAVFDVTESSTGVMVAATKRGLFRFDGEQWTDVGTGWGFPAGRSQTVWFDRDDGLWVGSPAKMFYLPLGGTRLLDPGMAISYADTQADFAQDRAGTTWMSEMYRSAHTMPRVGETAPLGEIMVNAWTLLVDRKGTLWVGSLGSGLRRVLDPTQVRARKVDPLSPSIEHFSVRDGLLSEMVLALAEDDEGNVWVGSARGLERFREGAFSPIVTPGSVRPRVLFATSDSAIWSTAYTMPGIYRISPHLRGTFDSTMIWQPANLFEDARGVIWSAGGGSIFKVVKDRFVPIPMRAQDSIANIIDIVVDEAGTPWVYEGEHGLMRLDHDSLLLVAAFPRWNSNASLTLDRQGRFWIAMYDRVSLYDHGHSQSFRSGDGNAPLAINGLFEDHRGSIWVNGEAGLSRFEQREFRTLSPSQGVPGRSIYSVAIDGSGAWWLATPRGVLRLPPGEADRAMTDSTHVLQYRSFGLEDGIPGSITSGVWGALVKHSADGRIWVAGDLGIGSLDPRRLPADAPPPVRLESMRVNDREQVAVTGAVIDPLPGEVQIDYSARTLSLPERVQFRYWLSGEDDGWREVGTRRRAYYTGLQPGAYTFTVASGTADGVWNETTAAFTFHVLPAWYQTLWFRALMLLAIGGCIAGLAVLLQRGRHQRAQQALKGRYEATLAERSRIAQDLHDTLLQGFAGVSMQLKVAERSLPDAPDVAAETLMHVQRLTRETLREARERVLDLHEPDLGVDDVAGALESSGRGLIATTGIAFVVTTTGDRARVPRPVEIAALRIGREAIANAVKHAEATRIDAVVHFEPARLTLEIHDNGRGLGPHQGEPAQRDGHLGLSGMRNRAREMGGSCEVCTGAAGGTAVTVQLPIA